MGVLGRMTRALRAWDICTSRLPSNRPAIRPHHACSKRLAPYSPRGPGTSDVGAFAWGD